MNTIHLIKSENRYNERQII